MHLHPLHYLQWVNNKCFKINRNVLGLIIRVVSFLITRHIEFLIKHVSINTYIQICQHTYAEFILIRTSSLFNQQKRTFEKVFAKSIEASFMYNQDRNKISRNIHFFISNHYL